MAPHSTPLRPTGRRRVTPGAPLLIAASVIVLGAPQSGNAQQTTENVTTQSSDAFGRTVSGERSGLYGVDDVRGFNPVDAGNARIQGLYFDQVDRLPGRILDSSSIRVGFAAQGYPFPAPTGLVDYALTIPSDEAILSLEMETGPYISPQLGFEWHVPVIGNKLGFSGGIGGRNQTRAEGGQHTTRNWGTTVGFRPKTGAQFLIFGAGVHTRSEEARPVLFPAGAHLPPRVPRGRFLGQRWTELSRDNTLFGITGIYPIGSFRVEGGVFRGARKTNSTFADILSNVAADGSATRRVVADGNNLDTSLSGELRLVRQWRAGSLDHSVTASVRGRKKDRLFGGNERIDLGSSSALEPDFRPEPTIILGPENRDRVREITGGLAYSLLWNPRLRLDLGLSKTRYRKRVDFVDPLAPDPETLSTPWLWNASASFVVAKRATAYIGAANGQEEALIAPDVATNRSESPPAISTRQYEAGMKVEFREITVVASAFEITKPYFNVDTSLRYRQLGEIRNRGVEVSFTGRPLPGLTVVSGVVLLDPRITGEAVDQGRIGPRPVGQVRRRAVLNVDWRLDGGESPLSFDLAAEAVSSRMANTPNTLSAPATSNFDLGVRYRFSLAEVSWLLRMQLLNVFNSYGWRVSSSGGFTYSNRRTALIGLVADF